MTVEVAEALPCRVISPFQHILKIFSFTLRRYWKSISNVVDFSFSTIAAVSMVVFWVAGSLRYVSLQACFLPPIQCTSAHLSGLNNPDGRLKCLSLNVGATIGV